VIPPFSDDDTTLFERQSITYIAAKYKTEEVFLEEQKVKLIIVILISLLVSKIRFSDEE